MKVTRQAAGEKLRTPEQQRQRDLMEARRSRDGGYQTTPDLGITKNKPEASPPHEPVSPATTADAREFPVLRAVGPEDDPSTELDRRIQGAAARAVQAVFRGEPTSDASVVSQSPADLPEPLKFEPPQEHHQ